ncbi:MAG: hypothetical protein ABIQ10_16200 [Gemmatimonadaceae bacterium]
MGRLSQRTASLTARIDLAITSGLTLQLYAQPLIGSRVEIRASDEGAVEGAGE